MQSEADKFLCSAGGYNVMSKLCAQQDWGHSLGDIEVQHYFPITEERGFLLKASLNDAFMVLPLSISLFSLNFI